MCYSIPDIEYISRKLSFQLSSEFTTVRTQTVAHTTFVLLCETEYVGKIDLQIFSIKFSL
jgi:hypothetical protein